VAVDAILGTGFSGAVREPARTAIVALGEAAVPVVAADVPSGVDASTGAIEDVAVRAHATATFHRAKPGLWIAPGKEHAGTVRVVDIAMPEGEPVSPRQGLLTPAVLDAIPGRDAASTKFSSGHVLVLGGSTGLTGAPCLAAEGAMRGGAGYVTCCVPASLNAIFEVRLLEVMTIALPDTEGQLTADGAERVLEEAGRRGGAMVVGPGLGRAEGTVALVRDLVARAEVPVVLDADGLNAHAGRLGALAAARRRRSSRRTPASSAASWRRTRRRSGRRGSSTSARRRAWHGRSWCSRATTRSSPSPTAAWRSAPAPRRRSRRPGRATSSPA
jgi:NAD(P)H-hydrate epimerase